MTALQAAPLPECAGCERPTRREVHAENGGLCTDCREQYGTARAARHARAVRRRA